MGCLVTEERPCILDAVQNPRHHAHRHHRRARAILHYCIGLSRRYFIALKHVKSWNICLAAFRMDHKEWSRTWQCLDVICRESRHHFGVYTYPIVSKRIKGERNFD